jgi:DNA processing protein
VTLRDLIAFSLLPPGRARAAALADLPTFTSDHVPGSSLLERLVSFIESGEASPARRAAELLVRVDDLLAAAARTGAEPIGWLDARYPPQLRTIADPPPLLWVRGDPTCLSLRAVAIVGSRAASVYGLSVAQRLAFDLAASGVTVVSGLARGCDGAAHEGALEAGGRTVGVVGCGPDVVYPAEHRNLYGRVVRQGAVVSELGPGTPPLPHHFPWRNRIISGLSAAVVIVEASERSGSLITAECALEQGRDVMAVPGNVLTERHVGSHRLLADGARLVQSARDVLEELGWDAATTKPARAPETRREELCEPLLAHLPPGEDCDVDQLAARSGLPAATILRDLTRLELDGAVRRTGAGRFVRVSR